MLFGPVGSSLWALGHPVFACACQQRGPSHHCPDTPSAGDTATTYRLCLLLGHQAAGGHMGELPQLRVPCVTQTPPTRAHVGEGLRWGWGLMGISMLDVPQPAPWRTWVWNSPCFRISATPSRLPHPLVSCRVLIFLHFASQVLKLTSFLSTGLCPAPWCWWSVVICGGLWRSVVVCSSPWRSMGVHRSP